MHDLYNVSNYPARVAENGAWDIYAAPSGACAAIPVDSQSGHLASHFGNLRHVAKLGLFFAKRGESTT